MELLPLGTPNTRRPPPGGFALLALGFRPFYLLASLFGAVAVQVWVLVWTGRLALPMPGVLWHAHEMLFGFAAAVIVGFLFTAGRTWTGLPTPTGWPLAGLALLWLAGRVAMAASGAAWAAVVDASFLPLCAAIFVTVLTRAKSVRNYGVGAVLALLAAANAFFHLARLGVVGVDPLIFLHLALGLVVLLETTIAGRVVPMFTASAIPGVKQWRSRPLDFAAIGMTGAALALWATGAGPFAAAVSAAAALLQLVRGGGWNPWATRKNPLLWVLHLSHLWIPLGLLLLAGSQGGLWPRSAGVHALGIGATGGLIVGMLTRTALGHTGRPLRAGWPETLAYLLVHLAALTRVVTMVAFPLSALVGIHAASAFWSLAFALYFGRYLPYLWRPRLDGKPG